VSRWLPANKAVVFDYLSDPGLCRIPCYALLHRTEVLSFNCCLSVAKYHWQWQITTSVTFLVVLCRIVRISKIVKMGWKKSLSEVQRGQIVALHNEGLSEHKIAAKLKVSKTAVHQSIKKFNQHGSYKDLHRRGRPRKTTIRDDYLMKRIVTRSPLSSINNVRTALLERGVTVGCMTVSRRLSWEFGLKSYKPARKPRLTPAMKAKWLAFA